MSCEQKIDCSKVGMTHVIGKGGCNIKQIQAETGAKINTEVREDDNKKATITVTADNEDTLAKAVKEVKQILQDQEEPDYEGPEGSKLRAKADAHGQARDRLKAVADKHFADGQKDEGHAAMKQRKEEDELMRSTSAEAARVILEHRNGGHPDSYLDLHGLRTAEAETFTTERLDILEKKKAEGTDLTLIPGAGHHSAPGKVALKPMVEKLLTQRHIEWSEIDAGSILAKVKGTNGTFAVAGEAAATADKNEEEKEKRDEKKEKGGCCTVM